MSKVWHPAIGKWQFMIHVHLAGDVGVCNGQWWCLGSSKWRKSSECARWTPHTSASRDHERGSLCIIRKTLDEHSLHCASIPTLQYKQNVLPEPAGQKLTQAAKARASKTPKHFFFLRLHPRLAT